MAMNREQRRKRRAKIAKFCENHTIKEAAEKFEVSVVMVSRSCEENSVTPKPSQVKNASVQTLKILREVMDGVPQNQVSVKYGISRQRVNQIISRARKAGWDI